MIMPSLSALFADSSRKMFGDQSPLLRSIFVNQMEDHAVFFLSPGSFNETWVQDLLPSVQALHIGPPW